MIEGPGSPPSKEHPSMKTILRVLILALLLQAIPSATQAEVLVYKFANKAHRGVKIEDGTRRTYFWPENGSDKIDLYVFFEPDEIDEAKISSQITRMGVPIVPGTLGVNHTKRQKRILGSDPGEPTEPGFTCWGRYRGPGNKRYLAVLEAKREPFDGTPRDSSVAIWQGPCTLLDIGGGLTEYYPLNLTWSLWRVDGGFNGSVGSHRDGRQYKTAVTPVALDLATTRAVNNVGLDRAGAIEYACDNLFPDYIELTPDP